VGSYMLTVIGTSGSLSHQADVTLTITSASNSSTTITFDDLASPNRPLTGQYPAGVIDWGSGTGWYLSGPWGLFTTQSISFTSSSQMNATFTFLSNSALASLQAYNGGSSGTAVTISCACQPH